MKPKKQLSESVRKALAEPPGEGYDCPICGEYQPSDMLRYHPKTHIPFFIRLETAELWEVYSFYLDRTRDSLKGIR